MSTRSKQKSSMRVDVQVKEAWHNCWDRNRHAVNRMNRGLARASRKRQTRKEIDES